MPSFNHLKASLKLKALAENPINLTEEGVLTSKRIDSMLAKTPDLTLLYGTERVDDKTMSALFELAAERQVLQKMEAMQAGEILNYIEGVESENREVLHTAMRDFFDNRQTSERAKAASDLAYAELEKLKEFLLGIDAKNKFTDIVQIGIGGSHLGPEAIYHALEAYRKPNRRAHFLSNVDPDDGAQIFKDLNLSNTLFIVVSKSGSTLETLTNEQFVKERLKKAGLNPKDHLLSVTGKGSPMDDPSKYLASFYIWDYIGGRYSVTSMVGGVLLAFILGMDRFLDFLRGAHSMDRIALNPDVQTNLPLLSALLSIWNRNFLGHPTCAVIPYSQALYRFPAHLQQLSMESNGKHVDKKGYFVDFETGPIIWGEPGTNGQHSFYQLLHQGTTVVPLEFITFRESQYKEDVVYEGTTSQEKLLANMFAQSISLAIGQENSNPNKVFQGNRPTRILLGNKLTPFVMGAILSYYEHQVTFEGFIWNINSFDQEGVQLGKVLALKIIDQMRAKNESKPLDPKNFPLGQAFLKHL